MRMHSAPRASYIKHRHPATAVETHTQIVPRVAQSILGPAPNHTTIHMICPCINYMGTQESRWESVKREQDGAEIGLEWVDEVNGIEYGMLTDMCDDGMWGCDVYICRLYVVGAMRA